MKKRAQSFIEYALLLAVISMAFMAMYKYVERSAKANLKLMEEKVNAEPELRFQVW
ncbi:MAG: hypothetical protein P9L96_02495 [Candidatus Gygaella obscura]|nr:hypothetical protein [Candidatus Gygaella obscura]